MRLLGARRCFTVHVPIVNDEVERFDRWILRVTSMHGLTLVADDDVLHDAPDDVVEDRHQHERDEVGEGRKDGADGDDRDSSRAIEVFLKIELVMTARSATLDERAIRRRDDAARCAALFAGSVRFACGTC